MAHRLLRIWVEFLCYALGFILVTHLVLTFNQAHQPEHIGGDPGMERFPAPTPPQSFADHNVSRISIRYPNRSKDLDDACNEPDDGLPISANHFKQIYFNDDRKLIYCSLPSGVSFAWENLLIQALDKSQKKKRHVLKINQEERLELMQLKWPSLSKEGLYDIEQRSVHYDSVIIASNGFKRVLRAYKKVFMENHRSISGKRRSLIGRIKKDHRKEPISNVKYGVTMDEFIQFVVAKGKTNARFPLDGYWRSIERMCMPCFIEYNLILKEESFNEDGHLLLKHLVSNDTSVLPFPDKFWKEDIPPEVMEMYNGVSNTTKYKFYDYLRWDLKAFGYLNETRSIIYDGFS